MRRRSLVLALSALSVVAGCGAAQPALPDRPADAMKTEQSNLLLFPVSDAEALLGRAVQTSPDGKWTISDARSPGCEVKVRKEPSVYSSKRVVDMHSMTSLSTGYAKLIGLEARFGHASAADIDITNTLVLKADTRGSCGDVIVDSVFVGHGKRSILASAELAGKAAVEIGGVTPGVATDDASKVVDTIAWDSDQAYGFTFKKASDVEALALDVTIPAEVTEGDAVEVKLATNRKAYLVVYYLDESGQGSVLWPSNEERSPVAAPGKPAVLPSPAEKGAGFVIRAALGKSGKATREALVAYAFSEKGDFDRLAPEMGGSAPDGASYAASLTQKLADVPLSRWSRAMVHYVIVPKK